MRILIMLEVKKTFILNNSYNFRYVFKDFDSIFIYFEDLQVNMSYVHASCFIFLWMFNAPALGFILINFFEKYTASLVTMDSTL